MMQNVFSSFKIKELRDRILYVFFALAVFVLAVQVTVPGVNYQVWQRMLQHGDIFQFLGLISGGALNNFSVCAMGITPYINASIIMQLLTVVIPKLHELQKEGGDMGRRKISQYIRSLTMGLALLQATMMVVGLSRYRGESGETVFYHTGIFYLVMVIISLTAGTAFLMWLGEQITDKGIGNGVSLLIFAGIVLRYPQYVSQTLKLSQTAGASYYANLTAFLAIAVLLVMSIILITIGVRKIPIQYTKRVVGRRIVGGASTYLPIRVNNAGVISIIFAISILYLPPTLTRFLHPDPGTLLYTVKTFVDNLFNPAGWFYNLTYALLVILFTYFYSAITFNISDVADNLKKSGGFVPGIRPGRPTVDFLERVLNRITFVSAIYLAFIAVAPTYVMRLTNVTSFYLGSTSLLIIVGVALDTMQQIEARLVMRHYQGFMK
ncbi:MAG: preprotein translocase subunit SecY [Candidatus Eremiobacteraeota bacterium]|nr:preprotein translocase subunit SecY [Candidatus Eremiobacteraeota bacterium]